MQQSCSVSDNPLNHGAGISGAKQRFANVEELNHLHNSGAIKARAQNTVLISMPLLSFAISRVAGKCHLVPSLQLLGKASSHTGEVQGSLIPSIAAGPALPPLQPAPLAPSPAHPVVLPECTVNLSTFPKHYRLNKKLQAQEPLHSQMVAFHQWLVAPIQLDRNGGPSASRTVQNIVRNVYLYQGFLHWHLATEDFSLLHFLDLDLYSKYISFQLAKENSRVNLSQQLSNARKVLAFLKRKADARLCASISSIETWMLRLSKQIVALLPQARQDIGQMEQEGTWLPASDLVALLDKLRVEAVRAVNMEGCVSEYGARLLHDAALSSTMFGYIPPPRLSCLRTLQVPWLKGCLHVDCIGSAGHHDCGGNRLEMRGRDMWMILPHHKNQVKWSNAAIQFRVPEELQSLLELYLKRGHSIISPQCQFVFTDHKCKPMVEAAQMSYFWEQLLKRLGSPAVFPPNR